MGMDKKESVFEELKQEARYAQGSYSEQLLYQAYGKAQMARQLEAITQDEFMEINGMTIRFMNTDREYNRRKNMAYTDSSNPKDGGMTLTRIIAMGLIDDSTEVYVRPNSGFGVLAQGNRHSDNVLHYADSGLEGFRCQDDNKVYADLN